VTHYFGDTSAGAATAKFHAAIERLMGEWDVWHDRALEDDQQEDDPEPEEAEFDDSEPGLSPGR
jgi:hypothetical protein